MVNFLHQAQFYDHEELSMALNKVSDLLHQISGATN